MKDGRRGNALVRAFRSAMGMRLAIALINYGLFWALTRLVDTPVLGAFSLLMNVFFLLQLLPLLGLSVPLMRRAATHPETLAIEIANAFCFALPVALAIALGVGLWGVWTHAGDLAPSFWLIGLSLVPTAWTIVAEAVLVGQERFGDITRIVFVECLLRALLALAAIRLGLGLTGVFTAMLLMRLLAAALYARHPDVRLPRWHRVTRALQRRNWREVPVFLGIAVVAALLTRLDVIALSSLRDLQEVAVYAAASRLYEASLMIPTVMAVVLMPVMARAFQTARDDFGHVLEVVVRTCLVGGLALALVASALSDAVIGVLYAPDMAGATPVLQCLVFASALMLTDVVLSSAMLAANAQKMDLRSLVVGLAALVIGLWVCIPVWGPTGAALAVVAGLIARLGWRLRWIRREFALAPTGPLLARLALAMSCGVAALRLAGTHGVLAAIASFTAFVGAIVLLGVWGRHPLARLRADVVLLARRAPSAVVPDPVPAAPVTPVTGPSVLPTPSTFNLLMDSSIDATPPDRAEAPLSWAQTRHNIRRDYDRVLGAMGEGVSLPKKLFWFLLPTFLGLFMYRLSRHAYVNGWRNLARLLSLVNSYLTRIEIQPTTSIGGGCLLGHSPVALCGRIGENFTFMGYGAVGGGFDSRDIGAGPGLPVVGDNVVIAIHAVVLGAIHIGDGVHVGPGTMVTFDVPAGGLVLWDRPRVIRGGAQRRQGTA